MVNRPSLDGIAKVTAGSGAAGVVGELTVGLDRANQVAGDVLRGIFGGLPWEMAADALRSAAVVAPDVVVLI